MREMHRSALVPYSAEQMFNLIEQVEHYPEFLPWCTRTQLIERSDEIVDKAETPGLAAVAENGQVLAPKALAHEGG